MANQTSSALPASTCIQIIRIVWDKSARGGEMTVKRNAVPWAAAVSDEHLQNLDGFCLVEKQNWNVANQFAQPFYERRFRVPASEWFRYVCVSIEHSPCGVNVSY